MIFSSCYLIAKMLVLGYLLVVICFEPAMIAFTPAAEAPEPAMAHPSPCAIAHPRRESDRLK